MNKMIIFYVEDEQDDVIKLRASLAGFNVQIIAAAFDDAIERLRSLVQQGQHPTIILLDLVNRNDTITQATDIQSVLLRDTDLKRIPVLAYSKRLVAAEDFKGRRLPYAPLGNMFQTHKSTTGSVLIQVIEGIIQETNGGSEDSNA